MRTLQTTAAPETGSVIRVRLPDGRSVEGTLVQLNERTVRLRVLEGSRLMVLSRRAATLMEAA